MSKTISVVVNARLGSSRVKQKLVRPFGGRSLLDIALEKLNRMDFFDARFLAVAEPELMAYVKPYPNVRVLPRDAEAVKPGVNPPRVTFAHYTRVPTDWVFVFNPCLPLVSVDTVRKACDRFQETAARSYTSVIRTRDWVFDAEGEPLTNRNPANLTTNKGDFYYKAAHAFHIVNKAFFAETGLHWTFTKGDPFLIEMPEEEYADVDTEPEFKVAEALWHERQAAAGAGAR